MNHPILRRIPVFRQWIKKLERIQAERDRLARKLEKLQKQAATTKATAPSSRSLAFGASDVPRFWWHRLPGSNYVPPIYSNLTDAEWQILQAWFEETTRENLVGECAVPLMSLLHGLVMGSGIRRIAQLGTASGYSSLLLGFFLRQMNAPHGLFTCEVEASLCTYASRWLAHAGLSDFVRVEHRSSHDPLTPQLAQDYLGGAPQLVFIDSSHEYAQTLAELELWYPHLSPGGMIVLHDTSEFAASFDVTSAGGVRRAIREWSQSHPQSMLGVLNDDVPAITAPGMVYQDFCGAGVIQKPTQPHV